MKFVAYELFSVDAESAEDAKELTERESTRDGIVVVGESLKTLFHPAHLAEAEFKFSSIGAHEYEPDEEDDEPSEDEELDE